METRPHRVVTAPPRTTIVSILGLALADLAYLAVSLASDPPAAPAEVAGRLLLAAALLVPGVALLRGADPLLVQRRGPLVGFLASVAVALMVLGLRGELRAGYLGFLPAVPLVYALVFPLERRGAATGGLTLLACLPVLFLGAGLSTRFMVECSGALLLCTLVAVHGGRTFRRALAGEAEAVGALARSELSRSREERLAAVGRLADRVAHDVNSPLGSLRSNIRFAQDELRAGRTTSAVEALEDAAACGARIQGIVGALGSPARRSSRGDRCDPAEAARAALRLGALRLPTGVPLDLELAGGLPALPVERDDLVSLLEQMLVTASEAATSGPVRLIVKPAESSLSFSVEHGVAGDRRGAPRGTARGVGLALCEEQGRMLGGRVALVEEGSVGRLSLELPVRSPPPPR